MECGLSLGIVRCRALRCFPLRRHRGLIDQRGQPLRISDESLPLHIGQSTGLWLAVEGLELPRCRARPRSEATVSFTSEITQGFERALDLTLFLNRPVRLV